MAERKTPLRPTHVKVGHMDFEIRYLNDEQWKAAELPEGDGGQMNGSAAVISVRDAKDQHELHVREILLHEILHACFYASLLSFENMRTYEDIEETIVMRSSPVLLEALRANPKVLSFILS